MYDYWLNSPWLLLVIEYWRYQAGLNSAQAIWYTMPETICKHCVASVWASHLVIFKRRVERMRKRKIWTLKGAWMFSNFYFKIQCKFSDHLVEQNIYVTSTTSTCWCFILALGMVYILSNVYWKSGFIIAFTSRCCLSGLYSFFDCSSIARPKTCPLPWLCPFVLLPYGLEKLLVGGAAAFDSCSCWPTAVVVGHRRSWRRFRWGHSVQVDYSRVTPKKRRPKMRSDLHFLQLCSQVKASEFSTYSQRKSRQ